MPVILSINKNTKYNNNQNSQLFFMIVNILKLNILGDLYINIIKNPYYVNYCNIH